MIKIEQKEITTHQHILFDIKKLELNSYIPFDIFIKKKNGFVIIVKMGTLLADDIYNKLLQQDKLYVSVNAHSVKDLTCANLKQYVTLNIDLNQKLLDFLYKIYKKNYLYLISEQYYNQTTECLNNLIDVMITIIQAKKDFIQNTVQYFSSEYTLETHSLHVSLYAINLGKLLNFNKEQLFEIGLSGLLHDVGIKMLDSEITKKESNLTPQELQSMHQHPQLSVSIAKHNHVHNPYIVDAILHHHERYDGSGYPDKLIEQDISKYASILAICDVFDALTNNRPYRKKYSSYEALNFMIKDKSMKNKFNNTYLKSFLKSLI